MPSRGTPIISAAAAVAVLCFFLPWFLVSCDAQGLGLGGLAEVQVSGWDLATGDYPELFVVLFAALGCLVAAGLAYGQQITVRRAATIVLGLVGLSLLLMLYEFIATRAEAQEMGLQMKLRIGFWGTMLAYAAAIAGAVWDFGEHRDEIYEPYVPPVGPTEPYTPAPPPVTTRARPKTRAAPRPRIDPTLVPRAPAPSAWLIATTGARAGSQFGLTRDRNTIGRDGTQCDLVLDDPAVSKQHAQIRYENGTFVLYDLAARNGTFLNNQRIQRQSLRDGDKVRVGDTVMVFKTVQ